MKIFALDDEEKALELLMDSIKEASPDSDLEGFRTAEELLEKAKNNPPDVAFLDIQIAGDKTGLDIALMLKEIKKNINIIFCTGYSEHMATAFGMHASGYITKPVTRKKVENELENLRNPVDISQTEVYIKTFGHFEVFINGKPLTFKRQKSKELLALLVDREGVSLSTEQVAVYLYEDKNYDMKLRNQINTYISDLKKDLQSVGVGDLLIKSWGHIGVDKTKFTCDAYEFWKGEPYAINQYAGEYMINYSWAEESAARFYWK